MLFSVKNCQLKRFSKSSSEGLKRLMRRNEPARLKISSALRKVMFSVAGASRKSPVKPLWSPMTLYPFCRKVFATLPTTVFMPGAGPPPVRMAIASFRLVISYLIL